MVMSGDNLDINQIFKHWSSRGRGVIGGGWYDNNVSQLSQKILNRIQYQL